MNIQYIFDSLGQIAMMELMDMLDWMDILNLMDKEKMEGMMMDMRMTLLHSSSH
jgi:hypothetical protein